MEKERIRLDITNIIPFVKQQQIDAIMSEIKDADNKIRKGTGEGSDFLGWLRIGSTTSKDLISQIKKTANEIRKNADILLCIGIGGSYLGSKAGIEFLSALFPKPNEKKIKIYFCGNNLSTDYLHDLIEHIGKKDFYVNVISKSGTTTEPALAFRIIYDLMRKRYKKDEIAKRIICTTDRKKGALKTMAQKEGFRTFVIPDDVGGRFSVLTPVGLLPMACAGIDIAEVLNGAADFEKNIFKLKPEDNDMYKYAAIRNILYRDGKFIEILSSFHPALHSFLEWWKQLFAETEGKNNKGIFPAIADFTTDLHSIGQLIQQGERNIFETFLILDESAKKIKIPCIKENLDNLNYLSGKSMDFVNRSAYKGTAKAHSSGDVPNMAIQIPERSAYYLGQAYYFFEVAVAISGYLLCINPFNQPGVEAYKQNMFKLLGRPK